ncbi:MAG: hypothetical protein P9F75_04310 [Candidatus Contendobacter sp.]|nr:hypothetical protein [Candidatus Contendobacter sp.]
MDIEINPEQNLSPESVINIFKRNLDDLHANEYYLAYNFCHRNIDLWRSYTPGNLHSILDQQDEKQLPGFFKVPVENPPKLLNEYLKNITRSNPADSLLKNPLSEGEEKFKKKIQDAIEQLEKYLEQTTEDRKKAWEAVAIAVSECVIDDKGNPRIPITKSLKQALEGAFIKTAPFLLKIPLYANKVQQLAINFLEKLKIIKPGFELTLTPEAFAKFLRLSSWPKDHPNDQDFKNASEIILHTIKEIIPSSPYDDDGFKSKLEEACREYWSKVPTWKKIRLSLSASVSFLALFAAVLLIPIDGGTAIILQASIQELIGAAAIGALGLTILDATYLLNLIYEQVFYPYASDMFAITCDALNIPRPSIDQLPILKKNNDSYPLRESNTQRIKPNICEWIYWFEINKEALHQLKSINLPDEQDTSVIDRLMSFIKASRFSKNANNYRGL